MTEEKNQNQYSWDNSWDTQEDPHDISYVVDTPTDLGDNTDPIPQSDLIIDPITKEAQSSHITFISEVEEFNTKFNKPNNYTPTIGNEKDWKFVYDFILEELEEYKEACEKGDIIGVLDALCDITYVSLGNGTMLHGLKTKIWPAYKEIQLSNMSKACSNAQEALDTLNYRSEKLDEECHVEKVGDMYIVYRTRDRKVMKSINYHSPNLRQFFSEEEIQNSLPLQQKQTDNIKNELPFSRGFGLQLKPSDLRKEIETQESLNETIPNTPESDTEDYW